ncbi:MAG TPA: phosphosulfolactate synthase [Ktedonobacteraceae bacterium]
MEQLQQLTDTQVYLRAIGVPNLPPLLSPFDPGYDPMTLASHLEQSAHLMASLKISMACWMIAAESATRKKIAAARAYHVPVVTGGGPFEVAVAQGQLPAYLDLCAELGVSRIECGEGFTTLTQEPRTIVNMAHARGLSVQYEMGKKHDGSFTEQSLREGIARSHAWLDAGAELLVIEARESARDVGMFDQYGAFQSEFADRLARAFGLGIMVFEAPNKESQFALLKHFGSQVHLCNVRLEEILRVEIFRRGLHSDAFAIPHLRPLQSVAEHEKEVEVSTER